MFEYCMATDKKSISQRFLSIRESKQISQRLFAESLGISLGAEQNYERGVRSIPSEVLNSLYLVYDIDPVWVLNGPGLKPRLVSNRSGLCDDDMNRSLFTVLKTFDDNGRKIPISELSSIVRTVYDFYQNNPNGKGLEDFVKNILNTTP